jgi:hypothetical protein
VNVGTTYKYFNAIRCDNGNTVVVKSLYTPPELSNPDLLTPMGLLSDSNFTIGDIVTISDPGSSITDPDRNLIEPIGGLFDLNVAIGDVVTVSDPTGDFCCTINSITTNQNTNYTVFKPVSTISCITCPIYKTYIVNACDGTEQNVTILDLNSSVTLSNGTVVSTNINTTCYIIISYSGVITDNWVNTSTKFIAQSYADCPTCISSFGSGGGGGGGGGSS